VSAQALAGYCQPAGKSGGTASWCPREVEVDVVEESKVARSCGLIGRVRCAALRRPFTRDDFPVRRIGSFARRV